MELAARDLGFSYHADRPVLRSVSCRVEPGQITALLGPNGSGKTTLVRLLLGLRRPTDGDVTLDGSSVRRLRAGDRARRLSYVAQRPMTAFSFSVRQVVAMGRHAVGDRSPSSAIEAAMHRVGVDDLADAPFGELSVGQQQLAAIARALAQLSPAGEGKALLADEPLSALDPAHAGRVLGVLRDLADDGVAVGVVIHDVTTAIRAADRAIVLAETGRLAAEGPTETACTPELLQQIYQVGFAQVGQHLLPELAHADRIGS